MADIYSAKKRSEIMSRVKSKNTGLEKEVFSYLAKEGIRFRRHYKLIAGKPDIVIPERRRVVFIDGDFWHGWRFPRWSDKLSSDFWREKIAGNIRRDRRIFSKLRREGWRVLRVWGHQLSTNRKKEKTLGRIRDFLS